MFVKMRASVKCVCNTLNQRDFFPLLLRYDAPLEFNVLLNEYIIPQFITSLPKTMLIY